MQLSSCGYLGISAGPTAVRAECCRSACLLASDIGTHDSTAPGTALVTRTVANPVPVVCSGVSLCAWHSTGVYNRKPAADIRNRRSSPSTLCRLTDVAGAVNSSFPPGDRAFPVAAARAWNNLPSQTRAASSILTLRRETKFHLFHQSFG